MATSSMIYGYHTVRQRLKTQPQSIQKIYCLHSSKENTRLKPLLQQARQQGTVVELLDKKAWQRTIESETTHDIAAEVTQSLVIHTQQDIPNLLEQCHQPPLILLLDTLQDPHNVGACIRSAEGAGVDMVIFPKDKSAPISSTVQKVSSGATETMTLVAVSNLVATMKILQQSGIWITGLAGEADQDLYACDLTDPCALVVGAEGSGLRKQTRQQCDFLAYLPMAGAVSSLNVSVATGVSLYEALRQRQVAKKA